MHAYRLDNAKIALYQVYALNENLKCVFSDAKINRSMQIMLAFFLSLALSLSLSFS
jgi:hypothetical protein